MLRPLAAAVLVALSSSVATQGQVNPVPNKPIEKAADVVKPPPNPVDVSKWVGRTLEHFWSDDPDTPAPAPDR